MALVVANFTPVVRQNYRIGVPEPGTWTERLNTDAAVYGGSNQGNSGAVETQPSSMHGYKQSLSLTLPPLGLILLKHRPDRE
jgi:1,4-alpha-glucan branching enzyme